MPNSIIIPRFLWCESVHDVVRNKTEIPHSEGVHNLQLYVLYILHADTCPILLFVCFIPFGRDPY